MNQKYICVYGHFYQAPRQNALLEEIELPESAWPSEMNELQDLVFRLITPPELFYPDEKQQKEILEIAFFIDIDINSVFSSLYKTV